MRQVSATKIFPFKSIQLHGHTSPTENKNKIVLTHLYLEEPFALIPSYSCLTVLASLYIIEVSNTSDPSFDIQDSGAGNCIRENISLYVKTIVDEDADDAVDVDDEPACRDRE